MNCLFCNSTDIKSASFPRPTNFNGKLFSYKECNTCGLIFIDPLPGPDDYQKMYAGSYHEQFYFKDASPDFTPLYTVLEKYVSDRVLLDYGCGDGSFVDFFSKKGYECIGVEYDKDLVEKLRQVKPGIRFYTVEEFWALGDEKKFPVIYMGDVLEHLDRPSDFLAKLSRKLTHKGLLMAQGPLENNRNLALSFRKITSSLVEKNQKRKIASHVPYHIFFSTAQNQEALFKANAFKTLFYKVIETPWPFPSNIALKPVKAIQFLVAKTSMLLSRILPGNRGNRFIYVGMINKA